VADISLCLNSSLVQWLWSTLIQRELDELRAKLNAHRIRFDAGKSQPSGVSPNVACSLAQEYGGVDCLQKVDKDVVKDLMEELGGKDLMEFVSEEYADHAKEVFDTTGITQVTFENVWKVFSIMLPLI
jgi:hypothetical protein